MTFIIFVAAAVIVVDDIHFLDTLFEIHLQINSPPPHHWQKYTSTLPNKALSQ